MGPRGVPLTSCPDAVPLTTGPQAALVATGPDPVLLTSGHDGVLIAIGPHGVLLTIGPHGVLLTSGPGHRRRMGTGWFLARQAVTVPCRGVVLGTPLLRLAARPHARGDRDDLVGRALLRLHGLP